MPVGYGTLSDAAPDEAEADPICGVVAGVDAWLPVPAAAADGFHVFESK